MHDCLELYDSYLAYHNAKYGSAGSANAEAAYLEALIRFLNETHSEFLTKTSRNHVIYILKRELSENAALTADISAVLAKTAGYAAEITDTAAHKQNRRNVYDDIIEGIRDTVEIKSRCLNDCLAQLSHIESEIAAAASGSDAIPELSASDINEAAFAQNKCDEHKPIDAEDFGAVIEAVAESPAFLAFKNKRKRRHDALIALIIKKSCVYKRESVLLEVSSFEEIINQSIPKLGESDDDIMLSFASYCEDVFNEITKILRRNNVFPITAKPGERFNSREHEIIMAEKSGTFNKGEIIKNITSGYRHNDTVLLRACVIAAR